MQDRENNLSRSVGTQNLPPRTFPQGEGLIPNTEPRRSHKKRNAAVGTTVVLAGAAAVGALSGAFANKPESNGPATPIPGGIIEPSNEPIPSFTEPAVINTPEASFNVTFPPTVKPTQEPTLSPTQEPTLSPTETPAASNETPNLRENLANWSAPEEDPNRIIIDDLERWNMGGAESMNFGFAYDISSDRWNGYIGYVLGAEKVGDNQVKIYLGMEDKSQNRYFVSCRLGTPGDLLHFFETQGTTDGLEGSGTWVTPNDFFDQLSAGAYHNNIYVTIPKNKEVYRPDTAPYIAIEQSEKEAEVLFKTTNSLLDSDLNPSKLAPSINTTDISYTDSPYIDQVLVRPINPDTEVD